LFTTTMLSAGFVLGSEGLEGSGFGAVRMRKIMRVLREDFWLSI